MGDTGISAELKRGYDAYYEDGSSEWRRLCALDKANNIISLCREVPHASILDIGAGEGAVLERLSEVDFGERLFALEVSSSGVEVIQKKAIGKVVECRAFDGYGIPYEDGRFDLAILSHVVEHVEFPGKLLAEAGRVAGHVFVEVPLENTVRHRTGDSSSKAGHINFYTPDGIERVAGEAGLLVLRQTVTNPSRAVHVYRYGRKGTVRFLIKECLLRILGRMAAKLFVYHASLLCRKVRDD